MTDEAIAALVVDIEDALLQTGDESIRKLIHHYRDEWHDSIESEWYSERLFAANYEYKALSERTDDIDPEQFRQESCESLLSSVSDSPQAIRKQIMALLQSVWAILDHFSDFGEHAGEHVEAQVLLIP